VTLAFDLGLVQAKDPDATTVRVLVVARDLGTHDREWSIIVVDRTASRHDIDSTGRASPAPMRPKYPFSQIHLKLAENTPKKMLLFAAQYLVCGTNMCLLQFSCATAQGHVYGSEQGLSSRMFKAASDCISRETVCVFWGLPLHPVKRQVKQHLWPACQPRTGPPAAGSRPSR